MIPVNLYPGMLEENLEGGEVINTANFLLPGHPCLFRIKV